MAEIGELRSSGRGAVTDAKTVTLPSAVVEAVLIEAETQHPAEGRLTGGVHVFKRYVLEYALAKFAGNRTRAAQWLGIERTHIQRLINELGVDDALTRQARR